MKCTIQSFTRSSPFYFLHTIQAFTAISTLRYSPGNHDNNIESATVRYRIFSRKVSEWYSMVSSPFVTFRILLLWTSNIPFGSAVLTCCWGPSWSYGGWIYNLCNQTKVVSSNPALDEVNSIQLYVIKFVSDLWQLSGFLWVFRFHSQIKVIAMIYLK